MKTNKLLLASILAVSMSGCSTVKDTYHKLLSDEDEVVAKKAEGGVTPLLKLKQTIKIKKLWSTSVGDGTDGFYLKLSPVAGDGVIYAAERDGSVMAISSETGKRRWKTNTKRRVSGGPGHGEGLVLVGTRDGEVLALSEEAGKFQWKAQVSSEVLSAPKADLGVVVVRTVDGKAYGLDATTGKRLWVYERAVPLLTLRGTSAPQLEDGLAIIGFDGGILTALDITNGSVVWEQRVAMPSGRSTLDRMVDIDAEPIIEDGVIHVATFQGRVSVVELNSGRIGWVRELSSYAGLGVDAEHVYLSDEQSEVWALDRYSGNSVWKQEKMKARSITAPVSYGDYVVVGDFDGYLHWMNSEDGSLAGRVRLDNSRILTTPFVIDDTLYAYSSDGKLAAFKVK